MMLGVGASSPRCRPGRSARRATADPRISAHRRQPLRERRPRPRRRRAAGAGDAGAARDPTRSAGPDLVTVLVGSNDLFGGREHSAALPEQMRRLVDLLPARRRDLHAAAATGRRPAGQRAPGPRGRGRSAAARRPAGHRPEVVEGQARVGLVPPQRRRRTPRWPTRSSRCCWRRSPIRRRRTEPGPSGRPSAPATHASARRDPAPPPPPPPSARRRPGRPRHRPRRRSWPRCSSTPRWTRAAVNAAARSAILISSRSRRSACASISCCRCREYARFSPSSSAALSSAADTTCIGEASAGAASSASTRSFWSSPDPRRALPSCRRSAGRTCAP